MQLKHLGLAGLSMAIFLCSGCMGRAISEGLGAAMGPKGIAVVVEPISNHVPDLALEEYTEFELQPFSDDFGGHAPAAINRMMPAQFRKALLKNKIYPKPGGKTLVIRGRILSFEDATRATSQVFGPFEEVIVRVELVDKESGKVLGAANCIGRSTQTVNQGMEKKVEGLADAIAGWISKHYPKPPKENEKE